MLLMPTEKIETIKAIEQPNQENIGSLREKENYKFIGLLEVVMPSIKRRWKKKYFKKWVPQKNKKTWKQTQKQNYLSKFVR